MHLSPFCSTHALNIHQVSWQLACFKSKKKRKLSGSISASSPVGRYLLSRWHCSLTVSIPRAQRRVCFHHQNRRVLQMWMEFSFWQIKRIFPVLPPCVVIFTFALIHFWLQLPFKSKEKKKRFKKASRVRQKGTRCFMSPLLFHTQKTFSNLTNCNDCCLSLSLSDHVSTHSQMENHNIFLFKPFKGPDKTEIHDLSKTSGELTISWLRLTALRGNGWF